MLASPIPPATEPAAGHSPPPSQAELAVAASQSGSVGHGASCKEQLQGAVASKCNSKCWQQQKRQHHMWHSGAAEQSWQAAPPMLATQMAPAEQEAVEPGGSGSAGQLREGQARGLVDQTAPPPNSSTWRLMHGRAAEAVGQQGLCRGGLSCDGGGQQAARGAGRLEEQGVCGSPEQATGGSSAAQGRPASRPLPSSMDFWSNPSGRAGQTLDANSSYKMLLSHIQQQALLQDDLPQPPPIPPARSPNLPLCEASRPSRKPTAPSPSPPQGSSPPVPPTPSTHSSGLQPHHNQLTQAPTPTPAQLRSQHSRRHVSDWPLIMSLEEEVQAATPLGHTPTLVWRE
ncbi:hypothetical protein QJQ45_026647, partial [Haematococcus lacustris]